MIFDRLLGRFSQDLGIDLGTSSTLVYAKNKGIVINEPSVVAINNRTDQILAVGTDAQKMVGKIPPHISVIHPLTNGVISDFEVTEKMLRYFFDRIHQEKLSLFSRPRVVIGVPTDITEVERKAVEDAALSAGAREVYLIEESMAAAIGARLPVQEAVGNMIVDIGGGTTKIAVVSLGGIVTWKTIRVAGNILDRDIVEYAREHFNLLLGERVAENIKVKIGSAYEQKELMEMEMRGRDLMTGLPREIMVNDAQIRDAMAKSVKNIIDDIKATLEVTPPELIADIYERGIILTGGGALLRGLDTIISNSTQIPTRVTDDPLTCVARGTGLVLEEMDALADIIIPPTEDN